MMESANLALMRKFAAKQYGNRFVKLLANRLSAGLEPACILIQGDSTANETNEWFYKVAQWLASKYPAYTVLQRLWIDAQQNYSGSISTLQTGSAGDAYITLGGTNEITTTDKEGIRITGDLEVIVKAALNDWTPGYQADLVAKFGGAGNRGWVFGINTQGQPYVWWSEDGTNQLGGASATTTSSAAVPVSDGEPIWLKLTFDVDNGSGGYDVKYYTSPNGATWTQLGTTKTGAATTHIFASTDLLRIGGRGGIDLWQGKVYKVYVKSGINGKIVASMDAGLSHPAGTTTFKDPEDNTWTVGTNNTGANGSPLLLLLNASHPGGTIGYSTDVTRFGLQTPIEPVLAFINFGHNDAARVDTYQTLIEGLCTQLLTKYPNVGIIGTTQNPKIAPVTAANILTHAKLQRQIMQAMAKNNYGMVDNFTAMMQSGKVSELVSDSDGVHPTVAGHKFWADEVIKYLFPAVA